MRAKHPAREAALIPQDRRVVKALGHPLRLRIMELVVQYGEDSPVRMARVLGHPLPTVSRHVRTLRDLGFLELTRTEPRRGAVEHFYRARELAFIDDDEWATLPVTLRRAIAWQTFGSVFGEAAASGGRGGFDGPEMHLDRISLELTAEGLREMSAVLHRAMRDADVVQRRANRRLEGATADVERSTA